MVVKTDRLHVQVAAALAFAAVLAGARVSGAPPKLPVPCAANSCGTAGPPTWVTAGAATAAATQNALTVTQTSNSAVLNWASFDIGANGTVNFKQPTTSSVALNKIYSANPSQIFGNLNANGQVYLLNLNGFLFGPTARINVGSLLVSTLPINLTDANFSNGILSVQQNPLFDTTLDPLAPGVGRTSVLDANGNPVLDANGKPIPVQLVVQPGAQLTSADQGRLFLTGQNVTNGGTLTSPDGQVILAAGAKIYLQADSNPGLRGLIVEVDAGTDAWNQLNGVATNQQGAELSAPRGNVTMVGLAVNQNGRTSATTSVSANGSIWLEAGSGHNFASSGLQSTQGGQLTLGPQSDVDVLPELSSSATATSADAQLPSSITLLGEQVVLQGGAITAPGANLTAIAAANPGAAAAIQQGQSNPNAINNITSVIDPNARLRIDPGTTIDLSGSTASLPASATLVSAQLRSSELADDPTQRNGALHGDTVYVDIFNPPSPSLANVSGEIQAVPQNIAQRTEAGGTAIFESEGDAVLAKGASVNVSGGSTSYAAGTLQTSYLVGTNGQLYPIATANPLVTYVGVVNPTFTQTYDKWGVQDVLPTPGLSFYQPAFVQGASGGTVQFVAPAMVLQGALQGSAVNGINQRTPSTAVPGGSLILGLPGGTGDSQGGPPNFVTNAVRITTSPTPIVVADDTSLQGATTLELPSSYLTSSGFTSTQIFSNSTVVLPTGTPLTLPSGSKLAVDASRIDILSSITAADGTLSFQNVANAINAQITPSDPTQLDPTQRFGVYIGNDVILDVRGQWTNDVPVAQAGGITAAQTWQNGGNIALGVITPDALLSLGDDVALRASGGAWLPASGKLVPGTGGSISLISNAQNSGFDVGQNLSIDAFGVNGAAGGEFNLTAPRIEVAGGAGNWTSAQQVDDTLNPGGVFQVNSSLFSAYGIQTFSLTASGLVAPNATTTNVLTVDPNTTVDAVVSSLYLNSNGFRHASASSLDGFTTVATLLPYQRPPATVALNAIPYAGASAPPGAGGETLAGDIDIGAGASITTDALGIISLQSPDSIVVDGSLRAPGGSVSLQISVPPLLDAGFLPTQRIELGADGSIDVAGTFVAVPSNTGLSLGNIYGGGGVSLIAGRGAVLSDAGSSISIAGTSAKLDAVQANGIYAPAVDSSAGGTLTVFSGQSISLLGTINASAGALGTSGPASAGSLDVNLSRTDPRWATPASADLLGTFNQAPLTVELEPSVGGTATSGFNSNLAVLGASQISQSGFDSLRLAADVVQFSSDKLGGAVSLDLGRQIIIDAPAIAAANGAQASLQAPYVEVGYTTAPFLNSSVASGGSGTLTFSGNEIDLVGATVFQGTQNVTFASAGDLLLRGESTGTALSAQQGSVTVIGNLTLDAARIYPVTATTFSIVANPLPGSSQQSSSEAAPGNVTIGQTAANPGTPLSAGGVLAISADNISSTGTIYAPFGSITLQATSSLALGDGSLTSVSGGGLTIPYGQTTLGGQQWLYLDTSEPVTGVPVRTVSLQAPSIGLAPKATVDLSGGGELQAFEWVPGPGGSTDKLTGNSNTSLPGSGFTPGLYAVLPTLKGGASPLDPLFYDGSPIPPGETVYLSGGSGLAAGTYTILPPRYALEPGAFLIQTETQFQSSNAGSLGQLADGTPVVAGFLSYGTTGLHQTPGYVGFAVYPGSYGQQLAEYTVSTASNFFGAAAAAAGAPRPTLPADAGTLVINVPTLSGVTSSLSLAGQVNTAAAPGGVAAPIEISASDLVIGTPGPDAPSDAVGIQSSVLNGWQPGSLLLGGCSLANCPSSLVSQVTPPSDGGAVIVSANTVTIGTGSVLTAGEIDLVANQSIEVQSGATLQTVAASIGATLKAPPPMQSVSLLGMNGSTPSLLSVSDVNWLIPLRTSGALPTGAATVAVDQGATIASRGALSVDGVGGVTLNGTLNGPGAEWSLGSSSIAFVATGVQADALAIDPALLSQLNTASAVRLASSGAIDVMTPLAFGVDANGNPVLGSLTLSGSSLNNLTGAGGTPGAANVQFGAQTLTLEGSGASSPTTPSAGPIGAILSLNAGVIDIGPTQLVVNGFASTRANASGAIVGQGSGALNVGGDLTLTSAGITAAPGSSTAITATGVLGVASAASGAGQLPTLIGGALSLSGASLDVAGTLVAPSGLITLAATNGNVSIDPTAAISTAGVLVSIQNQSVNTPGGSISISTSGNLTLSPGAILDVSGADLGGASAAAGGTLSMSATGSASLGATIKGAGGTGGSFSLDAGSWIGAGGVGALDGLSAQLTAGGFSNALNLRARSGDLSLDAGSSLAANAITLTADTGMVSIGGGITADSAALRGAISVFGGAGVNVAAAASLSANGVGATGRGGTIEIGAGHLVTDQNGVLDQYNNAAINLDPNSKISAAGAAGDGTLLLRAPALTATHDVGIGGLPTDTSALGQIIIEPVLPFNTQALSNPSVLTAADFNTVQAQVSAYMTQAGSNISQRLAPGGSAGFMIEPGVEIIAAGDLTLPGLDLSGAAWRFNGAPIDLTVVAAGALNVPSTISDGFATVTVGRTSQPVLLPGPSSSLRLVAGADLSSANPLQAMVGGTGTLSIGPSSPGLAPAVVRTGSGDIDLVAAQDIVITTAGSGAYTAGAPAIAPGGNATNPYPDLPPTLGSNFSVNNPYDPNTRYVAAEQISPSTSNLLMSFPTGGGNLDVRAGNDIVGAALTASGVPSWQLRQSGGGQMALPQWGVNLAAYDWTFGTLGGGDVNVAAAHNAANVTVAAADSLLPQYGGATQYVTGGGLSFRAGGDIGSTQVFLADGVGRVTAGGALSALLPSVASSDTVNVGSGFYLQSSSMDVTARLGIAVDGIFNPTGYAQAVNLATLGTPILSYSPTASLSLESIAGDIVFGAASGATATLLGPKIAGPTGIGKGVLPGTLSMDALSGSIVVGPGAGTLVLYPAAQGQLDLLAAQNIDASAGGGQQTFLMSDAVPGSFASVTTPFAIGAVNVDFGGDVHVGDAQPALITAGGNIDTLGLSIPKASQVIAGGDLVNLSYLGQNLSNTDQTIISAGRDISYNIVNDQGIQVGGPGQVDVLAGRNISLGFARGILTLGNLVNANLPSAQGADLTVATGLGSTPDFAAFVGNIIAPSATYQSELVSYVEALQGSSNLTFPAAATAFSALPSAQQAPLIDQVFFNELLLSGRAANATPSAGFTEGYFAIDTLFPGSRSGAPGAVPGAYQGNLSLTLSQIYTLSGGNISLIVPGGEIDVGLATTPADAPPRTASELGIVAQGAGNVDIYSKSDVNVNSSRIFTLGGGNILIWSDEGSIDAGRGSKTAISAPPPTVSIDSSGNVTVNFAGAAQGSGIRTIQTDPNVTAGNVDLIAPVGTVDAGDAGIGAAGNINIAAASVIGVSNINFGGTATGVPAQISSIGASLSGASAAASSASNTSTSAVASSAASSEAAAPLSQAALTWLDVFVTGLGEENCKPDDIECLKRQKTPSR